MENISHSFTDAAASRNVVRANLTYASTYLILTGLKSQEPVEPTNNPGLSSIRTLVQQAMRTIFNDHPLCAIAEEHKKKAEALAAKPEGNFDAGFNNDAVYIEYCKYLILHPHTESPEYRKIFARVYDLEQAKNTGTSTPANESPDSNSQGNSNDGPRGSRTNHVPIGLNPDPQGNGDGNPGSFPALGHFAQWNFLLLGLLIGTIGSFLIQTASSALKRE